MIDHYYLGLQPRFEGDLDPQTDGENEATVKLSLRTISTVMNIQSMILENASICKIDILTFINVRIQIFCTVSSNSLKRNLLFALII